jgi:hypothetical protein
LLGRIVTLLFYLHAVFYVNFYIMQKLLGTKLTQFYIWCGIFGVLAFTAVGTTALEPLRRRNYRVFFIVHAGLATAVLPVLFFHVTHIRIYLYETAVVYVLHAVLRVMSSSTLPATVKMVPGANLVEVDVPLTKGTGKSWLGRWQPGQHAYLSLAGHPFLRTFKSNPFTVASVPEADGKLRFVARILDGNTAKLAQSAKGGAQHKITIEGPYGVATHADTLLRFDRVLLVAGGVGGTFIVPLYRQLLADLSPSAGSYRRQKISFLWVARTLSDVQWAVPEDPKEKAGFIERLKVCITGINTEDLSTSPNGSSALGADDDDVDRPVGGETEDGIELEERKNLLSESTEPITDGNGAKSEGSLSTYAGRPNHGRVVEQAFTHGAAERVAVVVCGPASLSRALRKEVGLWVHKGREVWCWEEVFGM